MPNSTNSWQSVIDAAPESQMMSAKALSYVVVVYAITVMSLSVICAVPKLCIPRLVSASQLIFLQG